MDFKEIKNVNNNLFSQKEQKNLRAKKEKKYSEQKTNEKTPINPKYWQQSYGIKTSSVSFGSNAFEKVDEAYIDKKVSQIGTVFHYLTKDQIRDEHKQNYEELIPFGKQVVDNYTTIMSSYHARNALGEAFTNMKMLATDFFKAIPDINSEIAQSMVYPISRAASSRNGVENYRTIIHILGKNEKMNAEQKASLFVNIMEVVPFLKKEEIDKYVNTFEQRIESYLNLSNLLGSDAKDSENFLISLTPEQMDELYHWIDSGKIEKGKILQFMQNEYNTVYGKPEISQIIDIAKGNDATIELISKLIQSDTFMRKIPASSMKSFLCSDVELLNKLISSFKEKFELDEGYIFLDARMLSQFLEIVNDNNVDDFINTFEGNQTTQSIFDAGRFVSPCTGLFDSRIIDKKNELEKIGVSDKYSSSVAINCFDSKTNEISPFAEKFLDLFYMPQTESGVKGAIQKIGNKVKNRYITKGRIEFYTDENPSPVLISMKNNKGQFEEKNYDTVLKVIKKMTKVYSSISMSFDELAKVVDMLKDENGIVDDRKYELFSKLSDIFKDDVTCIFKALEAFPPEKHEMIIKTCRDFKQEDYCTVMNFPNLAKFCFDKDGNKIPENIDFIKKILDANKEQDFSEDFLDNCNGNKEIQDFTLEFIDKSDYYDVLYFIAPIINAFKTEDGKIPPLVKTKLSEFVAKNSIMSGFVDVFQSCMKVDGDYSIKNFDNDMFDRVNGFRKLFAPAKVTKPFNGRDLVNILNGELKTDEINFKSKVTYLDNLRKIKEYIQANKIEGYDFIDKTLYILEKSLQFEDISLPVDKTSKIDFMKNIMFSSSLYTDFENTLISAIPLLETMNGGLNLTYSRAEFLYDLSNVCKTKEDIDLLKQKTGINPILMSDSDKIVITGYDGIIKLDALNISNAKEKRIYDLMHSYMYENEIDTGNKNLDKYLNKIIKACPEFINVIGKKQHGTHAYTVDVHSLLVMAYSINHPDYLSKLNGLDKALLKITTIFHDIAKQEGVVDKGHQNLSSLYTKSIVHKLIKSPTIQDRLFGLIDNHHWLEEYATSATIERTAQEIAFKFRRPNDFEIAKIMANADLKAVSESFYEGKKDSLFSEKMEIIEKNIDYLYANGNVLLTDYFVSPSKLQKHIEVKDGKEYKVVNLHNISDDENMYEYGFYNGIKKDDLCFLVHMVDSDEIYRSLYTVQQLSSPFNGGVLSESIISPKYKRTYANRKYGVILSQENVNVVNQASTNQGSGKEKGFSNIMSLLYNDGLSDRRNAFRSKFVTLLGLSTNDVSPEDYAKFYREVLSQKTTIMQINPKKEYKIGTKVVTGEQIRNAIVTYQNSLIDKKEEKHNEIVGYLPKIQAVIAKEDSFDKLPDDLLKFAYDNNYPIVLI